jgi:hypothetical protein
MPVPIMFETTRAVELVNVNSRRSEEDIELPAASFHH